MTVTRELFGIDTDPEVMAAREEYSRRFAANQNSKLGNKLVRLGRLQAATERLMRAEAAALKKLKKENGYDHEKRNSDTN